MGFDNGTGQQAYELRDVERAGQAVTLRHGDPYVKTTCTPPLKTLAHFDMVSNALVLIR